MQTAAITPPHERPQPPSQGAVLRARGLEKHFGRAQAVRGLDLTIGRGQVYGFLGPNGAGKTTTIRMLLGLIRPSGGEVQLFGAPLTRRRSSLLARVGALVETPSAYAHLTGHENLEVVRRLLAAPPERIPALLELVGLTQAAHRPVRGYSLGMKGRLSLAAALLGDPDLLILDEPTNGLDPSGIREMRDLIASLPSRGITVLISSHLLSEIEQVASHVGIIAGGRMRFEGTLAGLRARARPRLALEVDRPEAALSLLRPRCPEARLLDGQLQLPARPEDAASLNRQLVEAGFAVSRLTPLAASLEELFMELTGEAPPHPAGLSASAQTVPTREEP